MIVYHRKPKGLEGSVKVPMPIIETDPMTECEEAEYAVREEIKKLKDQNHE